MRRATVATATRASRQLEALLKFHLHSAKGGATRRASNSQDREWIPSLAAVPAMPQWLPRTATAAAKEEAESATTLQAPPPCEHLPLTVV